MIKKKWKITIITSMAICMVMSNTVAASNGSAKIIQILETVQMEENMYPKGRMTLP